jgi:hypothetical protein
VHLAGGALRPLDRIRLQGAPPLVLDRSARVQEEGGPQAERWSRTAGALGAEVFERVRRLRVTLVGAGRNGTLCAQQLAALGVARLRLVDGDALESHNLVGTLGLDAADVGKAKVQAAANSLLRLRPDLALGCIPRPVHDPRALEQLLRLPADLTVTCVDDDVARLAGWLFLARPCLTPLLDVGTSVIRRRGALQMLADARLFVPGPGNGCPVCVGGIADLEAALYALAAPPDCLERGESLAWHQARAGSVVSLNALAVGCGVQMVIDYLAGNVRTSAWQRLRWIAGQGLVSHYAPVASAAGCAYCRD